MILQLPVISYEGKMNFKNKILKELRNKGGMFLTVCAILSSMAGTVMAGSASALLQPAQSTVSTSALGNTTGKIGLAISNGTTGRYQVQGVLLAGISSRFDTEITTVTVPKDTVYYRVWDVPDYYAIAGAALYGDTKNNPKTGCNASVRISNQ